VTKRPQVQNLRNP